MPGYQQIENSQPSAFGVAAQDLTRLVSQARQVEESFTRAVREATSDGWVGDSRDAAVDAAERTMRPLREVLQEITAVTHPMADLGRTGEQGRAQLTQLSGEARALGFNVLPTGMVVLGPAQLNAIAAAGPAGPALAEELQLQAILFTEEIWGVMLWVSEADVRAGEQLMQLSARHGGPMLLPLTNHLTEHVFDGGWNSAGNRPVGYHHRPGGSDAGNPHGFGVVPGTVGAPDSNGVYRAEFSGVNATGVTVNKRSSFFPDSWSEDDVRQAIAGAFHARHPVYEWVPPTPANPAGRLEEVPGMWEGHYQGMTIRGYLLSPGQPGYRSRNVGDAELDDVATAFPIRIGDAPYGRRN
jgi:hypothetical protein